VDESFSYYTLIIFLALSAFFSGSETAFFSLSKIQLKKLEQDKTRAAKIIFNLLKKPRELLILILLGNTIANIAAATTAALIAINIGSSIFTANAALYSILIEIVLMTILLVVLGEVAPKLISFSSPIKVAKLASFILLPLKYILWPLTHILLFISNLVSKKPQQENETELTSEDFKKLVDSQAAQNSLEEKEKKIIRSVFRFSSTISKEIMIPRVDIVACDITEGIEKVRKLIIKSGHSRIPVFKNTIDNVIGIAYAKDILLNPNLKSLNSLLRPAFFITENVKIQHVLNQFKTKKVQIAIVVDEYGGTSGMLTLEDILEELVGEIMDEYDKEPPMFSRISPNKFLINGMYSIAKLNSQFNLDIPESKYSNVSIFLLDMFNRVPNKNEVYIYQDKAKFTIRNIKSQRINYVIMEILKP
jgi:CBS domain containing-hemolysin-like protein